MINHNLKEINLRVVENAKRRVSFAERDGEDERAPVKTPRVFNN